MTAVMERPVGDEPEDNDATETCDELVVGTPRGTCRPGTRIDAATIREAGQATAEYAIATIAAIGFGALLVEVLKSDGMRTLLENLFQSALQKFL